MNKKRFLAGGVVMVVLVAVIAILRSSNRTEAPEQAPHIATQTPASATSVAPKVAEVASAPEQAEEPTATAAPPKPAQARTQSVKERRNKFLNADGSLTSEAINKTRAAIRETVARDYRRLMDRLQLTPEQADLLTELLVDQMMSGFEASRVLGHPSQGGVSSQEDIAEYTNYNKSLLKDLLGADDYQALEDYQNALPYMRQADDAVDAVQKQVPDVSPATVDLLYSKLAYLKLGTEIQQHITDSRPFSAEEEASIRADLNGSFSSIRRELDGSVRPEELAALDAWFKAKIDHEIDFAKMIVSANGGHKGP